MLPKKRIQNECSLTLADGDVHVLYLRLNSVVFVKLDNLNLSQHLGGRHHV